MESFLIYIAKSALAAGAFYLLYLALFQHQKQFVFNRVYLPVSLALSFMIPLITFTRVRYIPLTPVDTDSFAYLAEATTVVPVVQETQLEWFHYLIGIYLLGALGFLLYLVTGHLKAISIVRESRLQKLFNVNVNITLKDVHPFSFFNKIVLSDKTLNNPNLEMIVQHEEIHVREKHTLDILFAEILFLFQWFNPFAWLLKDAIKNNLEYKTDNQLTKTIDPRQYQLAMIGLAHKDAVAPFLTALNGSQLKSRIIMMKKKTENKYALLKQLVVLPLLAVLIMGLSNKEVRTEVVQKSDSEVSLADATGIINHVITISGIVTDENGVLIEGAKIYDHGGNLVAQTTEDGKFRIDPEDNESTYTVLKDGYSPSQIENDTGKSKQQLLVQLNNIDESASEILISGKITDVNGSPLKAALVYYTDRKKVIYKTTSDEEGNYEIEINENDPLLVVRMDGYVSQTFEVSKSEVIDIKLKEIETDEERFMEGKELKHSENKNSSDPIEIKGKVTNEKDQPISGAAIMIKGKTIGTVSDREGNYKLNLADQNETLVFMMVDYKKQEIAVNGKTEINVQLVEDELSAAKNEPVYNKVEQMPQFPGGDPALQKYIADYTKYPQIALLNGIQGTVQVTFVVNKEGKVVNPKISGGVDPALDKEALRVVNSLPRWKPGKKEGKPVNVSSWVPVKFELTEEQIRDYKKVQWNGKFTMNYAYSVSGKVTDEKGQPVSGVAVIIKGKNIGTITDKDGNYELALPENKGTLTFLIPGFEKREISVNSGDKLNITLREKKDMGDVTVVGFGKMTDKSEAISFQGEKMKIRSVDGANPLYIVDGKIVPTIEELNSNDIKSIDVLKGETGTALYGESGKNGVILITTKTGKVPTSINDILNNKPEGKVPMYVVDGKKVDAGAVKDLQIDDVAGVSVLKGESATIIYGESGKNGVVLITTKSGKYLSGVDVRKAISGENSSQQMVVTGFSSKQDAEVFNGKSPLVILDGKKYKGEINDISRDDIHSISVLKDSSATALYGEDAKDGVILITTKSHKITSELELRKFIAQTIFYPIKARDKNVEGISKMFVRLNKDGSVAYVTKEPINKKDLVNLDEVVVIGYKKEDMAEPSEINETDLLDVEVKRVIENLPVIDIPAFKDKTLSVTIKFVLQ